MNASIQPPMSNEPTPNPDFASLVQRAMQGDQSTLPELRRYLDEHPALVAEAGNLVTQAERAWTKLAAGPNLVVSESISRELAALKAKLGRDDAPPLEQLMIDEVVLAWLEVGFASARDAQSTREPLSVGHRDHLQRRAERAHRRLLAATKQLALVRKLLQVSPSPLEIARGVWPRPTMGVKRQTNVVVGVDGCTSSGTPRRASAAGAAM